MPYFFIRTLKIAVLIYHDSGEKCTAGGVIRLYAQSRLGRGTSRFESFGVADKAGAGACIVDQTYFQPALGVLWIDLERLFKVLHGLGHGVGASSFRHVTAQEHEAVGFRVLGPAFCSYGHLGRHASGVILVGRCLNESRTQFLDNRIRDVVLYRKEVIHHPVVCLGPAMISVGGVYKLHRDPDMFSRYPDAALQDVVDAQRLVAVVGAHRAAATGRGAHPRRQRLPQGRVPLEAHDAGARVGHRNLADPGYQAFLLLRAAFTVAPIVFGLDKFTNVLVNWDQYLAPWMANLSPIGIVSTGAASQPYGACSDGVNFWITLNNTSKNAIAFNAASTSTPSVAA